MPLVASNAVLLLLATLAGFAWASVYPFPNRGITSDLLWLVVALGFFGMFQRSRGLIRSVAIFVASVSVVAGLLTLVWSSAAWGMGFWYPEFPPVLHRLFSADGEASYNASDAQLFIVLFVVFLLVALALPQVRLALRGNRSGKRRNSGT